MFTAAYIFITIFAALWLSMLLGNFGIHLELLSAVVFYLTVVFGWRSGAIVAAVAGVMSEMFYGCYNGFSLILLLTVALAAGWQHYYRSEQLTALLLPGFICGAMNFLPQLLGRWSLEPLTELLLLWLLMAVKTAILLPLTVHLMDKLAAMNGLRRFRRPARKFHYRH